MFSMRGRSPISIVHFVTERCNARCPHCFVDFGSAIGREEELSLDEIGRLADTLGRRILNVNLTGGEPFLREDLPGIVERYATRAGVRSIVVTTNGWFTDGARELARAFRRLPARCRLTVSVSFDAPGERHDRNRRLPGLFPRALETYRLLDAWPDPRVRADATLTVTPDNAGDVAGIVGELREAGVRRIFPLLVREAGALRSVPGKEKALEGYRELVRLVRRMPGPPRTGSAADALADALHSAKDRIVRDAICAGVPAGSFGGPCRAASLFGVVRPDGTVLPCEVLDRTFAVGNLREAGMDFLRLWNGAAADGVRERVASRGCRCTYECAFTVNVLGNPRNWPRLLLRTLGELA